MSDLVLLKRWEKVELVSDNSDQNFSSTEQNPEKLEQAAKSRANASKIRKSFMVISGQIFKELRLTY